MNKRSLWSRVGDFILGKGFYMVLLLCVMAIGGSGYYLYNLAHTTLTPVEQSVSAPAQVQVETVKPETVQKQAEQAAAAAQEERQASIAEPPAKQAESAKPVVEPAKEDPAPAVKVEEPASETVAVEEPPRQSAAFFAPVEGDAVAAFSATELTYNAAMGDWRTHNGVDLSAQPGETVCAVREGDVLTVSNDLLLGTTVTLNHGDGLMSVYANLDPEVQVQQGDRVSAGEIIGTVGSTAVGEHNEGAWLHFAVMKDGEAVDPMDYLNK